MKPAAFDYVRCETLDEAAEMIAQTGDDARILAGGQSLVAMLNMRLATPAVLVDVMPAPDARKVAAENGTLKISAAVRQASR